MLVAFGAQADAPALGHHLPAHLVFDGRAEREVWKICFLNRAFFNLVFGDAEALGQINARTLQGVIFRHSHSLSSLLFCCP